MKVYIAGSISDNANYVKQFKEAENKLKALGHVVINPCKEEGKAYKWYIDEGLKQLMTCEAIFMLKNWQQSKGACLEHKYAKCVGLKTFYEQERNFK